MCCWKVWIFLPLPKYFLFSDEPPRAITVAGSLLTAGTLFQPPSSTSSNQLLLTPAARVCRVPLRLAPVGSVQPLCSWKGSSDGRWPAAPNSDFSLLTRCAHVQYIYLAMRLGVRGSAAKELRREVAARSGVDLSFRCRPRKWEAAAISAFSPGAIPIPRHHSLRLVP